MSRKLLHIFRNNPLGRENLLQSINLCRKIPELELYIHFPKHVQCLLLLDSGVLTLELDSSYTRFSQTAPKRAAEILSSTGITWHEVKPEKFTSAGLEQLPGEWDLFACPRVISQSFNRIGLGRIGRKVRTVIKLSTFPIFIPSLCERDWNHVAAFFGGSELGLKAVKQALNIAEEAKVPVTVFTQLEQRPEEELRAVLQRDGVWERLQQLGGQWVIWRTGSLQENLWDVPGTSLAVVGAAETPSVRELFLGGTFEVIQQTLPNPLIVVGANCARLI